MKARFSIAAEVYAKMLDGLNDLHQLDILGSQFDLRFISDDYWLGDTAVIDKLFYRKGTWEVALVFAHHKCPVKFIARRITRHSCPKKAAQIGHYLRRAAAKDQRGTLYVDINELNLPYN